MRPERRLRLAEWLESVATQEDGSALALEAFGNADAEPARIRAKLFREIAQYLTQAPGGSETAIPLQGLSEPRRKPTGPP